MLLENVLKELKLAYDYYAPLSVGWDKSVESLPPKLNFLGESFLLEALAAADIKEADTIEAVKKVAKIIKNNSSLKLLLYHAHRTLVAYDEKNVGNLAKYPDLDKCLGEFTGIFYLILALSSMNAIKESFAKLQIAEEYALACLQWIAGTIQIYRIGHNNIPGHNQRQTYWIRHYIEGNLFRIGRLEFMNYYLTDEFPFVFRQNNTGEIVALCGNDWELDKTGLRTINEKAYIKSKISRDSNSITGIPNKGICPVLAFVL